jgi:outer membrane protein OmpA-like peptidoglycan-associated protein
VRATLASQSSLDVIGGIRFPLLVGLDAFVQGGPGLGGALGAPRFRVLAGVSFRSEPPPKLSFINEDEDRELQLALATPPPPPGADPVRPASTWELNSLTRGESQEASGQAKAPKEPPRPYQPGPQEQLVLRGAVPFSQGSTELPGVVPLLDQVILRLAEQPQGGIIIIEGHADSEGTETSSVITSLQRAQAVRRYLLDQGIPPARVRIRGFGSDWPVSANPVTEQERQLNRRAEVLVITEAPKDSATTQVPAP